MVIPAFGPQPINHHPPKVIILGVLGLLLVTMTCLFSLPPDSAAPDENTMKLLSIAETQHEIIQLLIQKENFPKALQELRTILDLNLPVRYEDAVFKEIVIVGRKLYDRGQKDLAYQSLEMGFNSLKTVEFKARILSVKAGLLKQDGKLDEAIETYKQEVELREKGLEK